MISLFEFHQAWLGSVRKCISARYPASLDVDLLYKLKSEVINAMKTVYIYIGFVISQDLILSTLSLLYGYIIILYQMSKQELKFMCDIDN